MIQTAQSLKTDYGSVILIPRIVIRPFKGQPRTHFDRAELEQLAESIREVGQKVPILVKKIDPCDGYEYELVDGQRRWHGCDMAGVSDMKAWVITVADFKDQFITSIVANFNRSEHTQLEIANAIHTLRDMEKTNLEIAKIFGKSMAWVIQHHNLLRLSPKVQVFLEPSTPEDKRISFATAQLLVNLPLVQQEELAQTISDKSLSMKQARHIISKTAQSHGIRIKQHQPAKGFQVLYTFVQRTNEQFEMALDTPVSRFREMLNGAKLQERRHLLEMLKENLESAEALRQIIETIEREPKKV